MKIEARYWRLEYVKNDSRKFYEVWLDEDAGQIWLAWGRINTSGQQDSKVYPTPTDARAKALAQVYAKQSKGYELVHEDLVIEMDEREFTRFYDLRRITDKAVRSGDATPRETALNYIEGFVTDCNEFLRLAKEGIDPDTLSDMHDNLRTRFEELKDKFDSAETMMQMVSMRALKRV